MANYLVVSQVIIPFVFNLYSSHTVSAYLKKAFRTLHGTPKKKHHAAFELKKFILKEESHFLLKQNLDILWINGKRESHFFFKQIWTFSELMQIWEKGLSGNFNNQIFCLLNSLKFICDLLCKRAIKFKVNNHLKSKLS